MRTAPGSVATKAPATRPVPRPAAHTKNPTLARALYALWSGDPAVVVDSPPGAGKTHLITNLAEQLHRRAGMSVAIAAQTRAQAYDVANRTARTGAPVTFLGKVGAMRPTELEQGVTFASTRSMRPDAGIVVATTARWLVTDPNRWRADVLLVDEAYQMTWADFGALGALARDTGQVALVGDPGQIDPVVVADTRRWQRWASGPQVPAPAALRAAMGDAVTVLRLPQTWRLGPDTTDLIRALYDLDFTSARPARSVLAPTALPEYAAHPITITSGVADPALILTAADLARTFATGSATVRTDDASHPVTPSNIAVIAPHVEQTTLLAAALADLPDIFVGTINQAQGLERDVVIAIHPLAGHPVAEEFATDLGRMCVALSRHRAHLAMVTDDRTPAVLARALRDNPDNAAARAHQTMLARLLDPPPPPP
ncbi:AAA family ATPase [Promicromonospora sp. NFX87]|uniref:AAA family ATPase n=1 Tax=Promicromonospora sp. NFX87 TaxID=3402691 RepID=UPI003AFB3DE0